MVPMPEIDRLSGFSDSIELDFIEREATREPLMRLSIYLHAAELSFSDTVRVLDSFGVQHARSTVHNWVQKADLQPEAGKSPNHVVLNETVIQVNN